MATTTQHRQILRVLVLIPAMLIGAVVRLQSTFIVADLTKRMGYKPRPSRANFDF